MQAAPERPAPKRRAASALEIALAVGNAALVFLLLCNGYDPNLERESPLDAALQRRRVDLLHLLLAWGADPRRVDLGDLFDSYDSGLFALFRELGVDLTEGHAMGEALAYHTSNRPLFGFAKRHREAEPKIQTELNIALAHHAGEGNEKGVQLCLWAGAGPHADARSLRFPSPASEDGDTDETERFIGFSAVHEACRAGHAAILDRLRVDPLRDNLQELYVAARGSAVLERLARLGPPENLGAVIHARLMWIRPGFEDRQSVHTLQRMFELGIRWERSSVDTITAVRWSLLKLPAGVFIDVVKRLTAGNHCAPEILRELGRTPSIRARLKEVGLVGPANDVSRFERPRPTRAREVLSKLGVELPRPKRQESGLPRTVWIGPHWRPDHEIHLTRPQLFNIVWSEPIVVVAARWGLSGVGLRKRCRRLQIPVPPRGYWAKIKAGQSLTRPGLPMLRPEEAQEIVICVPKEQAAR